MTPVCGIGPGTSHTPSPEGSEPLEDSNYRKLPFAVQKTLWPPYDEEFTYERAIRQHLERANGQETPEHQIRA
jgi:hypothetical protein